MSHEEIIRNALRDLEINGDPALLVGSAKVAHEARESLDSLLAELELQMEVRFAVEAELARVSSTLEQVTADRDEWEGAMKVWRRRTEAAGARAARLEAALREIADNKLAAHECWRIAGEALNPETTQ